MSLEGHPKRLKPTTPDPPAEMREGFFVEFCL
jgi:hypothetical protein